MDVCRVDEVHMMWLAQVQLQATACLVTVVWPGLRLQTSACLLRGPACLPRMCRAAVGEDTPLGPAGGAGARLQGSGFQGLGLADCLPLVCRAAVGEGTPMGPARGAGARLQGSGPQGLELADCLPLVCRAAVGEDPWVGPAWEVQVQDYRV